MTAALTRARAGGRDARSCDRRDWHLQHGLRDAVPAVWRPDEVRQLTAIPTHALYEAILVVKLGLFAALLVTGTQVLLRTIRPPSGADRSGLGFVRWLAAALGPPGIFYLATVPLILAAAMALRYVHILGHVAEVVAQASRAR